MSVLGAAVTLGGAALSAYGAYTSSSASNKAAKKDYRLNKKAFAETQRMNALNQRNYLTSTETRVADAKRAGIHPLYALGNSPNIPSAGSYIPGQSPSGSAKGEAYREIGRGVASAGRQMPTVLDAAQVESVNASATRDLAQAELALSQAKRVQMETKNDLINTSAAFGGKGIIPGQIGTTPSMAESHAIGDRAAVAAPKPAWQKVTVADVNGKKRTLWMPTSDGGSFEGMEGVGATTLTIMKNLGMLDAQFKAKNRKVKSWMKGRIVRSRSGRRRNRNRRRNNR